MSIKTAIQDKLPFYNSLVLPYHFIQAVVAGCKYGWPGKGLTVIGVTGTNGKTSTCFMIWKMLNQAGYKTGLMTTVAWGVDKLENQIEHMTTVDSFTLNKRIRAIRDAGAEFLVLEVTSHAMVQFRTLGVPIEVAAMTNVTHEHLDYHKTFERYRDAKRKLFRKAKFGVANADDKSGRLFLSDVPEGISYGIEKGELRARDVKLSARGVSYRCGDLTIKRSERAVGITDDSTYRVGDIEVRTRVPGKFNVYNSLAAVGVGLRLGLKETEIREGLLALDSVEGRMTRIEAGQDFEVIVDYAHTPDAFAKVFESVEGHRRSVVKLKNGKTRKAQVISLIGGAGRRDETTREERGRIAGENSDAVVVTEDDSRDENPEDIAAEFVRGAKKAGKVLKRDLVVEMDRERAIRLAIELAETGDLVLILGKGHEKTILRADGAHEFEDIKVATRAIKKRLERQK